MIDYLETVDQQDNQKVRIIVVFLRMDVRDHAPVGPIRYLGMDRPE